MTMDYKYIEQLLNKYFECETSLEEEQILRAFFAQTDVPEEMQKYQSLFTEPLVAKQQEKLSDNFDQRIKAMAEKEADSKKNTLTEKQQSPVARMFRMRPLYKAAASVAIVLALAQAAQMPYDETEQREENIARTMEQLQKVQQDKNSVAQSDTAQVKAEHNL